MLEDFKTTYNRLSWLRYITWTGLLCTSLFLTWFSCVSLHQFFDVLLRVSQTWRSQGLQSLLAPGGILILWSVAWYALIQTCRELSGSHARITRPAQRPTRRGWFFLSNQTPTVPFAISTHGGHVTMEDHSSTITLPRLRLPQKEGRVTRPQPTTGLPFRQPNDLHEIPTRPPVSAPTVMTNRLALRPLSVGIGWHSGISRSDHPNEDSLVVLQNICTYHGQIIPFSLYVVADGMGGYAGGSEASHLAMQSMMYTVMQSIVMGNELSEEFLTDMLIGGVQWANLAVHQRSQEREQDMGTTLTAALVVGSKAYIVNVGDSRTYLYRNDATRRLRQITEDHSLVARLVALGEIEPDEIYSHPERNKVYRCLGTSNDVEVDWFTVDLYPNDQLVLCSDGLWEMVRDFEIERILNYDVDPSRTCDMLVQAALRGGGRDNVSVIIAKVP